ncbi:MAG: SUMF1/EgtB/PvdO family nonheme iron enzyme, partial [Planctomycetaceae bacterium]|nr:SUMF1/EgtB/PvdO family nonheme iron enzyme [Planctomycetaceae bacterium]
MADLLAQCERELERDGKVSSVAGTVTKESVARRTKKEAEKTASKGVVTGILMMLAAVVLAMVIGPQVSRLFDTPIPSLPPVESGIGLKFDGKDDYVEVTGLDWNYPQFTIEAFVTSAPGSDNGTIAFLGSGRNDDREWMSLFDGPQVGPGKRISGAAIKGKTEYENAYGPFTGGERQHRALVFDGRSLNYYINGIWQGQRKAEPHEGLQWKMKVLRLGCDGSGRKFFQGVIDQLRVSRVARYSENFEVHVDLASDDQTLAMYRFDEREGARLRDLSGNGHDGKIVGAKWVQPIPSIVSANPSEFALQFDGVDDFALLPIKLGMVGRYLPDRPFTYEAFFTAHRQRQEVEQNALAKNALPPPLAPGVLGFFRIGGVTYIPGKHLSDWVESKQIFSDSPISENKEHHVAMVWDGQAMQMFVDGIKQRLGRTDVPRQSSESWSEFDDAAFSLCGMRTNLGFVNTFAGTIREVRISTTARYMEDFVPEHRLTPDGDTIGLYHCDDGSGDTLIDSSGQNHHGKIVGATWVHPDVSNSPVATSKPSFALQFDGVDDHVAIDSDIMGKTSSFTVEAIVTFPGNYQNAYILSGSGKDFQFGLGEINGQRGFLVRRDHNLTPQAHATDRINNQSVHVAGVWDGSTASFFLNGQRVDQGVNKQGLVPIGDRWGIGCLFDHDDQGTRFFQGTIHEIRISNYPRYDENFPPKTQFASDSRTLALYHFDEGQGNVLKDSSGNGHDGKIIGATWVPLEVRPSTGQQEFKWSNHWPNDAPAPAIAPFTADEARAHQEAWAQYLGVPVEYENSIGMKFRLIPPGEFLMGSTPEEIEAALKVAGEDEAWRERINSEAPQHKVVLTQPVYVGVTEVTQAQYERVMGTNPSHFSTTGDGKEAVANLETGNHPVEMVSWNDAAEFCAKLSVQEKLKPFYFRSGETITPLDGTGYRLPTEAEWESAC